MIIATDFTVSSNMGHQNKGFVSNRDIAHLLRSVAAAYLIKNENRFKIIAYENAADTVEHMSRELYDVWQEGKLGKVKGGIGPSIASHLDEYFKKGYSSYFKEIFKDIPETVFALMKVPTLGPKKAFKLVKAFGLNDIKTVYDDLDKIAHENKIATLPTFGKQSQDVIRRSLQIFKKRATKGGRMPLPYAHSLAMEVVQHLKKDKRIMRIDTLGSLRRSVSTIGDVDIAVMAKDEDAKSIVEHFLNFPGKFSVDNAGDKKASIITSSQIRVDLRVQTKEGYGSMLQYFTGSKDHNIKVREFALKKGLSLSEWGIKKLNAKREQSPIIKFSTEESFYKYIGLQTPPPELREGTTEVELARTNNLPKLVELSDIKGDMHIHSNYDLKPSHDFGANTYVEILDNTKKLSYEYVGFSDHNPKISDQTKQQIMEILKKRKDYIDKSLSGKKGLGYFIGLEVDILPNGNLAVPDEAFQYLDYMVVSIHSVFHMDIDTMTRRVLKALSFPKVKILAHPTGRLLGKREGYELRWDQVFAECKRRNIALEINSWPERLDLPDSLVREAKENGNVFMIDTDSHANDQMHNMPYGMAVARRGWCTKNDIINTRSYKEFKKWIEG